MHVITCVTFNGLLKGQIKNLIFWYAISELLSLKYGQS